MDYNTCVKYYQNLPQNIRQESEKRSCFVDELFYDWIIEYDLKYIIEVGSYYGRNTLFMAAAVSQINGHIISIDINNKYLNYAQSLIDNAGLNNHVTFICGDSISIFPKIIKQYKWNFAFIDGKHDFMHSCLESLLIWYHMPRGIIVLDDVKSLHDDGKDDGGVPLCADVLQAKIISSKDYCLGIITKNIDIEE